jgi:uncharacterized membrane protein SirB2
MSGGPENLGRSSAAFGISAAITALFNTALACAKDAYHPLTILMNKIAGHNWTTQALADMFLFVGLGSILLRTRAAEKISSNRIISFLTAAVVVAGIGLFAWYALY